MPRRCVHSAGIWMRAIRLRRVQASSSVDCRREPPRPAIASQAASPTRCPIVFDLRHGLRTLPSLYWGRAAGRGLRPRALNQVGTKPRGRWGNADRSPAPAPQSKSVTPASRLMARIAPLVAFGLGLRILATGPATYRQYSYCGVCGRETQNSSRLP